MIFFIESQLNLLFDGRLVLGVSCFLLEGQSVEIQVVQHDAIKRMGDSFLHNLVLVNGSRFLVVQ